MKGPIPSEHLALQDTFNGLAERCKNTANNPVSYDYGCMLKGYCHDNFAAFSSKLW